MYEWQALNWQLLLPCGRGNTEQAQEIKQKLKMLAAHMRWKVPRHVADKFACNFSQSNTLISTPKKKSV